MNCLQNMENIARELNELLHIKFQIQYTYTRIK